MLESRAKGYASSLIFIRTHPDSQAPNQALGPPSIAVGSPAGARILRLDAHAKFAPAESLPHADVVTSICWAPNVGRRYELIATGCRDGHVRIWKISDDSPTTTGASPASTTRNWAGVVAATRYANRLSIFHRPITNSRPLYPGNIASN